MLVAAKLTYALQPLDIRAFHPFKIHVRKEYQACRLRSPGGVVSLRDWLASVCSAICVVMRGRSWSRAFDSAGFGTNQVGISDDIMALLELTRPVVVEAGRPSEEQLRACFPRRSKVPSKAIWLAYHAPAKAPAAKPKLAGPPPLGPPGVAVGVRLGPVRLKPPPLRRSLRLELAKAASHVAATPCSARASAPPLVPPPSRVGRGAASSSS